MSMKKSHKAGSDYQGNPIQILFVSTKVNETNPPEDLKFWLTRPLGRICQGARGAGREEAGGRRVAERRSLYPRWRRAPLWGALGRGAPAGARTLRLSPPPRLRAPPPRAAIR